MGDSSGEFTVLRLVWGMSWRDRVIWHEVKDYGAKLGLPKLAPHDLRRSCLVSAVSQAYGIAADAWFEKALSFPLESTAVVT